MTRKTKNPVETVPVAIHDSATTLTHRIELAVRSVNQWKVNPLVDAIRRVLHAEFQRDPDIVRQWLDTVPALEHVGEHTEMVLRGRSAASTIKGRE